MYFGDLHEGKHFFIVNYMLFSQKIASIIGYTVTKKNSRYLYATDDAGRERKFLLSDLRFTRVYEDGDQDLVKFLDEFRWSNNIRKTWELLEDASRRLEDCFDDELMAALMAWKKRHPLEVNI
jgi:hypothetical protein